MKKLIYATAASSGGALTILNMFYNECIKSDDECIIITSLSDLKDYRNVKYLSYPKIKNSFFYRLFFYYLILPKLIKDISPDEILSLNNIRLPIRHIKQTIYIQQAIPFLNIKISLFRDFKLWYVKHILGAYIIYSIKNVDKVITQSQWLKEIIIKSFNIKENKVDVKIPRLDFLKPSRFNYNFKNTINFIYPASYYTYKNHDLILDATSRMKNETKNLITIKFTFDKNKNKNTRKLYSIIKNKALPIILIGQKSNADILNMYKDHILIFSSDTESFGLPLLEAKTCNTPIIVFDTIFARETLEDYNNVIYFKNVKELIEGIKLLIDKMIKIK